MADLDWVIVNTGILILIILIGVF
ncbi:MAG: hypothetical protein H6R30_361, partial [Methanomicrobia archaeon]|nr:hypothetical protein [Methanomicrobia archaeon]